MRCPTCQAEYLTDGACPHCLRPPALVPPTPVLPEGVTVADGADEYPLGLPHSLAELRRACEYRSLMRSVISGSAFPLLLGVKLLLFGYFTIKYSILAAGYASPLWSIIGPVGIGIGLALIISNVIPMIIPSASASLFSAVINIGFGAMLCVAAIGLMFYLHATLAHVPIAIYVAMLLFYGLLQVKEARRFAHLRGVRPSKETRLLLKGWLKELRQTTIAKDEDVLRFYTDSEWRARRMGDYVLLALMRGNEYIIHRRDFHILEQDPAYFGLLGDWRKATFELGARWTVKGIIAPEQYARYQRWCAADAGISEPPASVG